MTQLGSRAAYAAVHIIPLGINCTDASQLPSLASQLGAVHPGALRFGGMLFSPVRGTLPFIPTGSQLVFSSLKLSSFTKLAYLKVDILEGLSACLPRVPSAKCPYVLHFTVNPQCLCLAICLNAWIKGYCCHLSLFTSIVLKLQTLLLHFPVILAATSISLF